MAWLTSNTVAWAVYSRWGPHSFYSTITRALGTTWPLGFSLWHAPKLLHQPIEHS